MKHLSTSFALAIAVIGTTVPALSQGFVVTPIGANHDQGRAMVIQPDGKIVVAGHSKGTNYDFAVVRYNTDGSLDVTFGSDGTVTTDIQNDDNAFAVARQSDGKIVVAGMTNSGLSSDFALVRYNTNGTLDNGFGTNGKVTTNFGGSDLAYGIAIQDDGKIVAAGYSAPSGSFDMALARYNTNGALDVTFGSGGKVTTDVLGADAASAVAIQSDYKIVVAGYTRLNLDDDFALVRYNVNGALDNTFDSDGKVTTDMGTGGDFAAAMAIQPDGKIVAVGYADDGSDADFALARYNADGSLDNAFDSDGKSIRDFGTSGDALRAMALQSDGKIVAAGTTTGGNNKFTVARFNSDGSFDNSFDSDGKLITFMGTADFANAIAVQSDGKIAVAGQTKQGTTDDFVLARYLADGSLEQLLDVEELGYTAISGLVIFPNPLSEMLNLRYTLNSSTELYFTLADVTGRTIKFWPALNQTAGAHSLRLELPPLEAGQYLLTIGSSQGVATLMLTK